MNPSLLLNPRNRFKKQKLEKQAQRIAEHKAGLKALEGLHPIKWHEIMDFFDQVEGLDPTWSNDFSQDDTVLAVTYHYGNAHDQPAQYNPFQHNSHHIVQSIEDDTAYQSDDTLREYDPLGAELNNSAEVQYPAEFTFEEGDVPQIAADGRTVAEANAQIPPQSPSKAAAPKFDPIVLLSPSKRQRQQADALAAQKDTTADLDDGEAVSSVGLLERLHRVSDRDPTEMRKRKVVTTDDTDESKKKAKFNGISGGGMLSDAIKAQAKEQATTSGPPTFSASSTVDLTADDDEVTIVKVTETDKEVCLGQWVDARVNQDLIPMVKAKSFQGSSTMWPQMMFSLEVQDSKTLIINCKDPQYRIFGRVDAATAHALADLLRLSSRLGLRTKCYLMPRRREPGKLPGDACSLSYPFVLLLFAPSKRVDTIYKMMKHRGAALKDPNPHLVPKGCPIINPFDPKPLIAIDENSSHAHGAAQLAGSRSTNYVRTVEEQRGDMQDLFDNLGSTDDLPETEQHSMIKTPLLSHQKQALTFLLERERETGWKEEQDESGFSLWRRRHRGDGVVTYYNVITDHELRARPAPVLGGILADVMGLGKTLSVLSLVASTSDQALEFSKRTPPRSPERILKCNVKATLLVVPVSTIQNWEEQIRTHVQDDQMKVYVHHGTKRSPDYNELRKFDIVITGYQALASECKRVHMQRPLYEVQWFRIVLDEAHMIRNQATRLFQGCYEIAASRRWAVTGTPVQNRLEDLGSLFRFLRIKPFDQPSIFTQYFISSFKAADPEVIPKLRLLVDSVTLRRLKDRIGLPGRNEHTVILEFSEQEQQLYQFFFQDTQQKVRAITKNGLKGRTYAHILKAILRLRQVSAHGQELLNEEDLKLAEGYHKDNAIELGDSDTEQNDDAKPALTEKQAFDMFFLLRESDYDRCEECNAKIGVGSAAVVQEDEDSEDGGKNVDTVGFLTNCWHIYCPQHIDTYRTQMAEHQMTPNTYQCQRCDDVVRLSLFELKQSALDAFEEAKTRIRKDSKMLKHLGRYKGPHTKTTALLARLNEFREESAANPEEPPIKTVVFSGWTSHLDLIQIALENNNYKDQYVRLDGSMSRKARSTAIDLFRDDPSKLIMLATVGAAGLGLNLTVANKVFMMEPQYNPAAEAQAVDRVHRLGQRRNVEVVRLLMNDSIELSMANIQARKMDLADLSLNRGSHLSKTEEKQKRMENIKALFR